VRTGKCAVYRYTYIAGSIGRPVELPLSEDLF